jgi:GTP-dependent phosphoenolpyruvate carboxykinase
MFLSKVIPVPNSRRVEIFLETYDLTNHTTLYGGNSTLVSSSFGIRTSALDAQQTQWGGRFVF